MIDPKKIGRRIAEERKLRLGLSQEKMVERMYDKLHVSWAQPDLSNIERGGTAVYSLQKLDLLADFFEIPLQTLIFGGGMESRMACYYGKKMALRPVPAKEKLNPKHAELLATLLRETAFSEEKSKITKEQFSRFACGDYLVYFSVETHSITAIGGNPEDDEDENSGVVKLRFHTFFEDAVIATMQVAMPSIFMLMNSRLLSGLQKVIPHDVLDVTDPARWLNPWLALLQFPLSQAEHDAMEEHFWNRIRTLRDISSRPAFLIESVYVRESCRRKGMFRLMLDVLRAVFGNHLMWLNLEPSDGEELVSGVYAYPEYTEAEIGQFSVNAAIAEKLGFTIDPDLWRRRIKAVENGEEGREEEVRKCAFFMPDYIKEIIANDGDLVAEGRRRQKEMHDAVDAFKDFRRYLNSPDDDEDGEEANVGEEEEQIVSTDGVDFFPAMRWGACIVEMAVPVGHGKIHYLVGVRPKHGDTWFAAAEKSFIKHGLNIDVLERHTSPTETKQKMYQQCFEIAAKFLLSMPDILTPEKKAEWDRL